MRYPHSGYPLGSAYPSRDAAEIDNPLIETILLTAEISGRPLSHAAAALMAEDLAPLPAERVRAALARCRLELQGALTLQEIVLRLEDGRPNVDEAWDMLPRDESVSVVWTNEIVLAWSAALPQLVEGDELGARQTFQRTYRKTVMEARMRREPVRWIPSLGSDLAGRRKTLLEAVEQRRLSPEHVAPLLPQDAIEELMLEPVICQLH
jgi:hypothetical protein